MNVIEAMCKIICAMGFCAMLHNGNSLRLLVILKCVLKCWHSFQLFHTDIHTRLSYKKPHIITYSKTCKEARNFIHKLVK